MEKMTEQEKQGTMKQNKKHMEFLSYLLVTKKLTPDQTVSYAFEVLSGGVETVGFSNCSSFY